MELFRYSLFFFLSMLALAGVAFLFYKLDKGRRILAERILGRAAANISSGTALRRTLRRICACAALFFLIAAACVPQWGVELAPVTDMRGSLIVAVDVSLSMSAQDLKPNRLEHARMLLNSLADKFTEYRIGIVAFAGKAYTQCPLTDDSEAIKFFASQLKPGMLPMQGTDFSSAIMQTLSMTENMTGTKVLILITDGEDHSKDSEMAIKEAQEADLRIFPVGIGNPKGEPIPMTDSAGNMIGYKRDRNGKTVISRLGEDLLIKMAAATGSAYVRYGTPDSAVNTLLKAVNSLSLEKTKGKARAAFKNRYQWPLSLAFFFLLVELLLMDKHIFSGLNMKKVFGFAKGAKAKKNYILVLALLLPLLLPSFSFAESAKSMARKGNDFFKKKQYKEAAEQYSKASAAAPGDKKIQYNLGVAQYKNGEFEEASKNFESAEKDERIELKSKYNKANTLYKSKDIAGAVAEWKKVLRKDPKNEAAKFNLQKALTENNPNQCNNPNKNSDGGSGDKDKKDGNDGQDDKNKDKSDKDKKNDGGNKEDKGGQDKKNDKNDGKGEKDNKGKPDGGDQDKRNGNQDKEKREKQREKQQAEQLLQMMAEKEKSDADKQQAEMIKANARHQMPGQPEEDW